MDILLNRNTIGMDLRSSPSSSVGFSWGGNADMLLHEKPTTSQTSAPTGPRMVNPSIVKLKWNQGMTANKATRSLLSQSAALFTEWNKKKVSTSLSSSSEMVKTSRKYRSVIHATTEAIIVEDDYSLELFKTMSNVEMVWHLCEILFIDSHPPGVLLNQLLSWIRWHLNHKTMVMAETVLKSGRNPVDHSNFWKVLFHFIFSGQVDQIKDWINLYKSSISSSGRQPKAEDGSIDEVERANLVIQLVNKMPMYSLGQLSHEVDMRWSTWSQEVKEIISTGFFNESPLELIMNLISGNDHSLASVATKDDNELTWMHLLVAKMLFQDPFLKENDLSSMASASFEAFASGRQHFEASVMDRTLLSAFSYDLMQVVTESTQFNDNFWFASHFIDLLAGVGDNLSSHEIENPEQLRQFLLHNYADGLMSHESLWPMGVDYLDFSGRQSSASASNNGLLRDASRYRLELALERVHLKSETVAYKILDIAAKRDMKSLIRTICRTMAQNWIKRRNLSSALIWALKCEDSNISSFIANQMLLNYSLIQSSTENGKITESIKNGPSMIDADILSSLGPSMLVSEKLTFLAKYYELKQLMKQMDVHGQEAVQLITSLISSKISPPFFLMTLLVDSIHLLDYAEHHNNQDDGNNFGGHANDENNYPNLSGALFNAESCCILLSALENLTDLRKSPLAVKNVTSLSAINTNVINTLLIMDDDEFETREMEIRKAVSKCLAKNIVHGI